MKIFIDTGAFLAIIFKQELLHTSVTKQYKNYRKQQVKLFTSDYILDELFTRCLARGGKYAINIAMKLIESSVVHNELSVICIDNKVFSKAKEVLLKFSDHKISFTDATTYVLYKDFKIDEIFTLDSDFRKMGGRISF